MRSDTSLRRSSGVFPSGMCVSLDISADTAAPPRRRRRRVAEYVRDEPLTSLAIAAAAGFVVGGGLNSRIGQAMLTIVGRIALQNAATSFIAGIVAGTHEKGKRGTKYIGWGERPSRPNVVSGGDR